MPLTLHVLLIAGLNSELKVAYLTSSREGSVILLHAGIGMDPMYSKNSNYERKYGQSRHHLQDQTHCVLEGLRSDEETAFLPGASVSHDYD